MKNFEKYSVILAVIIGLFIGFSKVRSIQKEVPNLSYAKGGNLFEDYLCIDGYCHYGEKFSSFISSPNHSSWADLKEFIVSYNHPSSFMGPIFIGLINQIIHDIPISYMLISVFATLGSIFIIFLLIRRFMKEECFPYGILVLLIFHNHILLSFANLYQAPMVMLFVCLTMYQTIKILTAPSTKRYTILTLFLTFGLFTKVSFIPMLIIPVIALWIYKYKMKFLIVPIVYSAGLFVGVPVIIFGFFYWLFPGFENLVSERSTILIHWKDELSIGDFCIQVIALFQIYILLWFFNRHIFHKPVYLVSILITSVYFFAIASHIFPTALRLYLPIVPAIIILSIPGIQAIYNRNKKLGFTLSGLIILFNLGLATYSISG